MNKIILGFICVLLTGCTPAVDSIKDSPNLDKQYISEMRSYHNTIIDSISDDKLIGIAKDICSDFMFGYTLDEIIAIRMADTTEESRIIFGYVLLVGNKIYCPDYKDEVERLTW